MHDVTSDALHDIFKPLKTALRLVKCHSRESLSGGGPFKDLNILTVASMYIYRNVPYACFADQRDCT